MDWSTTETRCFFSRLVDGSAIEVQWQISGRRWTDWWRQTDAFSWNDQRRQHNATSSVHEWTDQRQSHNASSLGWSTVWLVTCNGKSAYKGGLINGGKTMLFLGMINSSDTTLLLPVAGEMIDGRDTALLLSAGWRSAAYVRQQISVHGRTDWRRQHDAFSWYDWRRQHNATSSGCGWTDQRQRHSASSLGWLTVGLVMCNGESACTGGLIDGGNTMLFLGKIDGGDTTQLHLAGWWWGGTLATRLVWQTKFWRKQK